MDKKLYYISLHTSMGTVEIRDSMGNTTYDFEIEATPEDISRLEKLVANARGADIMSFLHPHYIPGADKGDEDNAVYDQNLNEIYRQIYRLGTPSTQAQLQEMGILNALEGIPGDQVAFDDHNQK